MAKHIHTTKNLNAKRHWYARMLEEFALDPCNKPAA